MLQGGCLRSWFTQLSRSVDQIDHARPSLHPAHPAGAGLPAKRPSSQAPALADTFAGKPAPTRRGQ
ncbi:MAG: hypothetical protein DI621_10750 [Pseudomonas protegens]|nr:MAG: hypothetical protein DI621_10750 [Pseudomonas protegens]